MAPLVATARASDIVSHERIAGRRTARYPVRSRPADQGAQNVMNERQSEAVASLCLMAALADGGKSEAERERMKRIFESLEGPDHASVYPRVMLGRATIESEAALLDSAALRTLAYELAVGLCDADGATSPAEREFLARLARALGIDPGEARRTVEEADAVAEAPLDVPLAATTPASVAGGAAPAPILEALVPVAAATPQPEAHDARERAVDDLILRTAMVCGGLELLPQNLATLGILPMQTKLVHDVGRHYGVRLDRGHIVEFIATIGAGMTSQVLEGYARKFLGKLAKKHLGSLAGTIGRTATGAAMSFASTWAIGQVARQYYAGGRTLSAIDLQRIYTEQIARGREVYARRAGAAVDTGAPSGSSGLLDLGQLFGLLKGR
jgi:tellurite resistance protein/uncharacterized protein (DUF697 family)